MSAAVVWLSFCKFVIISYQKIKPGDYHLHYSLALKYSSANKAILVDNDGVLAAVGKS